MKTFKIFDLLGQIAITVSFLIALPSDDLIMHYIYWLFTLGGWQFVSFITHLGLHISMPITTSRKRYGTALLVCLALAIIPIYGWAVLLFSSPIIAVWYFVETYFDLKVLMFKRLPTFH